MTPQIPCILHPLARLLWAALLVCWAALAAAATPLQVTQAPGYYRMMVGSFEVTALYDGYIDLDSALLKNTSPKEVQSLMVAGMHLPFPGIGHVRAEGKGYAWVPVGFGPIRQ